MERGKVDLSSFEISWYQVGAGKLKRIAWYFTNVLFFMNPLFPFVGIKPRILRAFGAKIGKHVVFHTSVNIKYPWKLRIGDYCWIGENVWIDNLDQVTIGDHVVISQGALILGGDHNYKKSDFPTELGPITLEDGCWIGAKAVVTRRVTVGTHALLTVGSMASRDLDPYGIYQGNPAKKVRERVIER